MIKDANCLKSLSNISDDEYLAVTMYRDIDELLGAAEENNQRSLSNTTQELFLLDIRNSQIENDSTNFFSNTFEVDGRSNVILLVSFSKTFRGFERYILFNKSDSRVLDVDNIDKRDLFVYFETGGHFLKYSFNGNFFTVAFVEDE